MKSIAVFDIDGTILKDSSAERIFVRYLISRGELNIANAFHFLGYLLLTFPRNRILALKGNRFYLRGKSVSRIEELAGECFREEISSRISDVARGMIEEHRSKGLEIVLLSGTLDVLLRHFKEHLGADSAHGSSLTVSNGRYTGYISGSYPYGRAKAEIVRSYYDCRSYDLSTSYAYANDTSDFEFLMLFGKPLLANPTTRLIGKAKRKGIDIVYF